MIKQSASEWCYFRPEHDPATYYRRLKAMGFAGVEMVDPGRWAAARAAGLEVVNLSAPGMEKGLNRIADHALILPRLAEAIATAAANRIPQVIVFSGNRDGIADRDGIAACTAGLAHLAPIAEAAGVTLVLEVLNRFDHVDYHADRSSFAFAVVEAVASPALRVLYDIYHMQRMGERLLDTILANLRHIAHFHIAGSPRRDYPGADQEIAYAPLVAAIHAAGYRGFWGQEFIPTGDPLVELERVREEFAGFVA